ncbi:hypothetical protein ACWFNE_06785 [Cellulomonas sp. NPDC055163]
MRKERLSAMESPPRKKPTAARAGHCLMTVEVESERLLIMVSRRWFLNYGDSRPIRVDPPGTAGCVDIEDALNRVEEFLLDFEVARDGRPSTRQE